jgi:hypothetical protein
MDPEAAISKLAPACKDVLGLKYCTILQSEVEKMEIYCSDQIVGILSPQEAVALPVLSNAKLGYLWGSYIILEFVNYPFWTVLVIRFEDTAGLF